MSLALIAVSDRRAGSTRAYPNILGVWSPVSSACGPNGNPTQQGELPGPAFTGHNVGDHWVLSVLTGRLTWQQLASIARRLGGALAVSVVLLTGTAVALLLDFALRVGDELITAATGLGELRNVVEIAGLPWLEGGG